MLMTRRLRFLPVLLALTAAASPGSLNSLLEPTIEPTGNSFIGADEAPRRNNTAALAAARRRVSAHGPPAAALERFGVYWVHTPKSGSSFGLAVLQACDPEGFKATRRRPTDPKLDSVTSPRFSGFCNDWLTKLVIGEVMS